MLLRRAPSTFLPHQTSWCSNPKWANAPLSLLKTEVQLCHDLKSWHAFCREPAGLAFLFVRVRSRSGPGHSCQFPSVRLVIVLRWTFFSLSLPFFWNYVANRIAIFLLLLSMDLDHPSSTFTSYCLGFLLIFTASLLIHKNKVYDASIPKSSLRVGSRPTTKLRIVLFSLIVLLDPSWPVLFYTFHRSTIAIISSSHRVLLFYLFLKIHTTLPSMYYRPLTFPASRSLLTLYVYF